MELHTETEKQQMSCLPVIQRLDRLELLVNHIEEEKNMPAQTREIDQGGDPCKDLSTVLEEVPLRGSLMERVASLERRVLKLTQEFEEERSESLKNRSVKGCGCKLEEKLQENKPELQIEDQNVVSTQEKELEEKKERTQESDGKKEEWKSKRKINPNSRYWKWLASISTRC